MSDDTSGKTKTGHKSKVRKFFEIDADYNRGGIAGFELENEDKVRRHLSLPRRDPRYSELPEQPRFLFDRKLGRPPRDIEGYVGHWLISDKMKAVFEAVDRDAFAFASCDVQLPDGTAGPHRWLCSVTRVLDALDDEASQVKMGHDQHGKYYVLNTGMSLVFRDDVVGPAHIFRMAHYEVVSICDQTMKDACKQADLKGLSFRDVLKY